MAEESRYEAAEVSPSSAVLELKFFLKMVFVFFKALLLTIPDVLKWSMGLIASPKPKNISGQLAVVTGGSNGIGKFIALHLAAKGCNVAIANRNHQEGQATALEIRQKYGVKVEAFRVDVSRREDVAKFKVDVESSMGPVDILVNNAADLAYKISLLEGTDNEIQKVIDTNLTSNFWVCLLADISR